MASRMEGAWRSELLAQVEARDRPYIGVKDLYTQYCELLRTVHIVRNGSTRAASNFGLLQLSSTSGSEGPSDVPVSDELSLKEQELNAAQVLLKERDEELREKDEAQAELSRQATRLAQENADLKRKLERSQQDLKMKSREVDRLSVEIERLGGSAIDPATLAEVVPPEIPATKHYSRRLDLNKVPGELTCIAVASGPGAPLPQSLVAVGTSGGYVWLLDAETVKPHAHIAVSRELPGIVSVDLSQSTGLLLAACADHGLRLLDLRNQKLLHTMRGHLDIVSSCGFLGSSSTAFTTSRDCVVKLWDLDKGQTQRSLPVSCPVTAAGVHRRTGVLVVGRADGGISAFDPRVSDALSVATIVHNGSSVVAVRVAPSSRSVLSQSEDGTLCITELGDMKTLFTLGTFRLASNPPPLAFSPDGAYVLASDAESVICWRAADGERVCTLDASEAVCICWDMSRAISAHRDGHVLLWAASSSPA